jgi:Mg2+-importing ATPase
VGALPTPAAADAFWTGTVADAAKRLGCGTDGLTAPEAQRRLDRYGPNRDRAPVRRSFAGGVLRRCLEPLALLLVAAALVSGVTGDSASATIILLMLVLSIGLDSVQERKALDAAEALRRSVAVRTEAKRDGQYVSIPAEDIVPGDLIRVLGGDVVPADALILEADSFQADEAALTGEPYPVDKRPGPVSARIAAEATNALFRGSIALGGEAVAFVVATGRATISGDAAAVLAEESAPSPFQKDLRSLGFLIVRMTGVLVVVVLTAHVMFGRPVLQSLMFAAALAVGLTPELLPMITTVTLARGAVRLARRKVIVKRLSAIHDLGAMSILCTDKTGTLTSAHITLSRSLDPAGTEDGRAGRLGALCAQLGGDRSAIDAAMIQASPGTEGWRLLARRAFDFQRKYSAAAVDGPEGPLLIVKGAPEALLTLCTASHGKAGPGPLSAADHAQILDQVRVLAEDGLRTVAIASRAGSFESLADPSLITGLVFEGLCVFADPPKATAGAAIARLAAAGVQVKILSGDHPAVVKRLAALVGLNVERVLTGQDIVNLSADALAVQVRSVDAFARLTPDQKVRLVRALQASGAVVGFLGDGINDAPGLKIADIGLSVDGASGVAREAADMILLDTDLGVVADGVAEGRRTFVNVLKYVRMGGSSNFGNMLSMAAASLLLPFLPMLPTQILLNNLLYDISEVGLPLDNVSAAEIQRPQIWSLKGLMRFAAIMGPLSSVFDLLTFAVLFWLLRAAPAAFRAGWFLESMATQVLVIFIIRTRAPVWTSKPHPVLTATSLGALAVALMLPFSPLAGWLGFQAPSASGLLILGLLVLGYLVCAELLKRWAFGPLGSGVEQAQGVGRGPRPMNQLTAHEVGHVPSGSR